MAIAPGHVSNFETLRRAFAEGRICLVECRDKKSGESVAVICAVNRDGIATEMVPFARMFNGNPYDELHDPFESKKLDEESDETQRGS